MRKEFNFEPAAVCDAEMLWSIGNFAKFWDVAIAGFVLGNKIYPAVVFDYATTREKRTNPTLRHSYAVLLQKKHDKNVKSEFLAIILQNDPVEYAEKNNLKLSETFGFDPLRLDPASRPEVFLPPYDTYRVIRFTDLSEEALILVKQIESKGYMFEDKVIEMYMYPEIERKIEERLKGMWL